MRERRALRCGGSATDYIAAPKSQFLSNFLPGTLMQHSQKSELSIKLALIAKVAPVGGLLHSVEDGAAVNG